MTRSRRRKLVRERAKTLRTFVRAGVPLASAIIASMPAARAQDASADTLQTVVVTAQKIEQNLQNVPISVEVFDNTKLTQLNITNIDDYVEFAPAISYVRSQGEGGNGEPGTSLIYIRGVVSGGDGNHSGSQPSVGVYFDEQPVTTITGAVPLHMYDVNRIEVLEGPQGTLFGASSEAGTVRIISNKPDPSKFEAGYNVQGNIVQNGGPGGVVEGFVNIPLWHQAAIRLVGWDEHDGGYISNVAGTDAAACIFNGVRTFPSWATATSPTGAVYPAGTYSEETGTGSPAPCATGAPIGAGAITNAPWRAKNYNTVDTLGGRAELRFNLGDDWTVTPTVQGESDTSNGDFGYDPAVGYLELTHFGPENSTDKWEQTALTIEGKVSNFDIVYSGGYLKRTQHSISDYSDYSEFYDKVYGSGAYYDGNNGQPIMPQQFVIGGGDFEMWSQEARVTTPLDLPVHGTAGVFLDREMHNIWQLYTQPGYDWTNVSGGNPNGLGYIAPNDYSVPGFPNAIWLTDEQRVDRDRAVYGQVTWDITHQLSLTGGMRFYEYDNSLLGFYGFNANFFSGEGTGTCFAPAIVKNSPCTDLDTSTSASGHVPRVNLTYKLTPNAMVYATYSKGFRPGGVNRIGGKIPYAADFLINYEVGWKTQWLENTLRWNGALFWENWDNFQFSFLGPNSVTEIANGGNARITGVETSVDWLPVHNLMLSTDFTLLNPVLTTNYCGQIGVTSCPGVNPQGYSPYLPGGVWIGPLAPAGTNLPVTPKFKGNVVARYTVPTGQNWTSYAQLSGMYQSKTAPVLLANEVAVYHDMPAYALFNLKIGADSANGMHVDFFITNLMNRLAELSRFTETNPRIDNQVYIVPAQPRTFGVEFGQDF
jgi:iron complex outermembrane recepter protein